jgi:prepilin-type N-terminal cleavage/methylation domain-containing protein
MKDGNGIKHGFSFVEILVVASIMAMMTVMAAPKFASTIRGSNLQIATQTVLKALRLARAQAMSYRCTVSVNYGDEPQHFKQPLTPGVLPAPHRISVFTQQSPGGFSKMPVCPGINPPGWSPTPEWYPYIYPQLDLTNTPLEVPDAIRIIAGRYFVTGNKRVFSFPLYDNGPVGEIKRHQNVIYRDGAVSVVTYIGDCYTYPWVLVFDERTGEHAVIEAGDYTGAHRPYVVRNATLTHIGQKPLTDRTKIGEIIDDFPSNGGQFYQAPNL